MRINLRIETVNKLYVILSQSIEIKNGLFKLRYFPAIINFEESNLMDFYY